MNNLFIKSGNTTATKSSSIISQRLSGEGKVTSSRKFGISIRKSETSWSDLSSSTINDVDFENDNNSQFNNNNYYTNLASLLVSDDDEEEEVEGREMDDNKSAGDNNSASITNLENNIRRTADAVVRERLNCQAPASTVSGCEVIKNEVVVVDPPPDITTHTQPERVELPPPLPTLYSFKQQDGISSTLAYPPPTPMSVWPFFFPNYLSQQQTQYSTTTVPMVTISSQRTGTTTTTGYLGNGGAAAYTQHPPTLMPNQQLSLTETLRNFLNKSVTDHVVGYEIPQSQQPTLLPTNTGQVSAPRRPRKPRMRASMVPCKDIMKRLFSKPNKHWVEMLTRNSTPTLKICSPVYLDDIKTKFERNEYFDPKGLANDFTVLIRHCDSLELDDPIRDYSNRLKDFFTKEFPKFVGELESPSAIATTTSSKLEGTVSDRTKAMVQKAELRQLRKSNNNKKLIGESGVVRPSPGGKKVTPIAIRRDDVPKPSGVRPTLLRPLCSNAPPPPTNTNSNQRCPESTKRPTATSKVNSFREVKPKRLKLDGESPTTKKLVQVDVNDQEACTEFGNKCLQQMISALTPKEKVMTALAAALNTENINLSALNLSPQQLPIAFGCVLRLLFPSASSDIFKNTFAQNEIIRDLENKSHEFLAQLELLKNM